MRGRSIAYQVGSIPNDTGTTSATPANAARSGASIHSALGQMATRLREKTCRSRVRTKGRRRSEEHTSELQSLMRTSYAVFCLNKKKNKYNQPRIGRENFREQTTTRNQNDILCMT